MKNNNINSYLNKLRKIISKELPKDECKNIMEYYEEYVADAGFDPIYGARPLRRAIRSRVEDPISEAMLEGNIHAGGSYVCDFSEGQYTFTKQ